MGMTKERNKQMTSTINIRFGVFGNLILIAAAFLLIIFIAFTTPSLAQTPCFLGIAKSANILDGTEFVFELSVNGGPGGEVDFEAGNAIGWTLFESETLEVREIPTEGWTLVSFECDIADPGLIVTEVENGFNFACGPNGGNGEPTVCTWTNFRSPVNAIPTLSEWGMIAMAGSLGIFGFLYAMRRKRIA